MADIKTHLRELSVATTVGLLKADVEFSCSDLYDSKRFLAYANRFISNDITSANNLLDYTIVTRRINFPSGGILTSN